MKSEERTAWMYLVMVQLVISLNQKKKRGYSPQNSEPLNPKKKNAADVINGDREGVEMLDLKVTCLVRIFSK